MSPRILWVGRSPDELTTDGCMASEIGQRLVSEMGCEVGMLVARNPRLPSLTSRAEWAFRRDVADPYAEWHLRDAFCTLDPDLVITTGGPDALAACQAALAQGRARWLACLPPLACSAVAGASTHPLRADHIIVCGQASLDGLRTQGTHSCAPLGVDPDVFRPLHGRRRLRRDAGVGDQPVVLCLGWCVPPGAERVVAQAFEHARASIPDAVLCVVATDSSEAERWRDAVTAHGVAAATLVLDPGDGRLAASDGEALNGLLALADVLALPALDWDSAVHVGHAAAAGVAVVGPDGPCLGVPSGYLVAETANGEPGPVTIADADALGESLASLLGGHAAGTPRCGPPSWDDAWEQWQGPLERELGAASGPRCGANVSASSTAARRSHGGTGLPGGATWPRHRSEPAAAYTPLVLHASVCSGDGLGSVGRILARQLHEQGMVVDLRDPSEDARTLPGDTVEQALFERMRRQTTSEHRHISISVCRPDEVRVRPDSDDYNVLYALCPGAGVSPRWLPALNRMDELWAPQGAACVLTAGGVTAPVFCVPLGVDTARFHPEVEPLPLPTSGRFTFLHVGPWDLCHACDVLLCAFGVAFSASDPVCLVCKVPPGQLDRVADHLRARGELSRLASGQVIVIDDWLTTSQMGALYTAVDCLVMPRRTAGTGLCALEARAVGTPVIACGWGTHTASLAADSPRLIGVGLRPAGSALWAEDPSLVGQQIAEPQAGDLAQAMRRAVAGYSRAARMAPGVAGQVATDLDWDRTGAAVCERLRAIGVHPWHRGRERTPRAQGANGARIALVQPVSLGDLVMLDAVIRGLMHRDPGASITVVTQPQFAPVLAGKAVKVTECEQYLVHDTSTGVVEQVYGHLPRSGEVGYVHQDEILSSGCYDRVINLRSCQTAGDTLLGHFCGLAGVSDAFPYTIDLAPEEIAWAQSQAAGLGPLVGLHYQASASGPWRSWPTEEATELCCRLHERGARVVVFGGPGDERLDLPFIDDWIGRATIRQTMALVGICDAVVAVDSSVMHMALALDRPLVSLWCGAERNSPGYVLRPLERMRPEHTVLLPDQIPDALHYVCAKLTAYSHRRTQ